MFSVNFTTQKFYVYYEGHDDDDSKISKISFWPKYEYPRTMERFMKNVLTHR